MTRIKLEEIKGITADRHKSACAESDNIVAEDEGAANCHDGECQIDWQED